MKAFDYFLRFNLMERIILSIRSFFSYSLTVLAEFSTFFDPIATIYFSVIIIMNAKPRKRMKWTMNWFLAK